MAVDVSAVYHGGRITEFYPKVWKGLELIPPTAGDDLEAKLPIDPKKPHNHHYEARAVPDAAYVKGTCKPDKDGNPVPDEWEKFVFYRGVGTFETHFRPRMHEGNVMSVVNHHSKYGMKHAWVLQSTEESVRWEKLPEFAPYVWKDKVPPVVVKLSELDSRGSREESIEALVASMVESLIDAGLTEDEAASMVATWDEQWYGEPGQRVFTIPSQELIDSVLPLKINPAPSKVVRVFVHRQELLSPETLESVELALHPETEPRVARGLIAEEEFGRFVHGALGAVADHVSRRTRAEYYTRGLEAIKPPKALVDLGTEGAELYLMADYVAEKGGGDLELVLATGADEERCRVELGESGKTGLWLYKAKAEGPVVDAERDLSLLLRIVGRKDSPDEVYLKVGARGAVSEPGGGEGWTVINREGDSNADLARVVLRGAGAAGIENVRVAGSFEELAEAPVAEVEIATSSGDAGEPGPVTASRD